MNVRQVVPKDAIPSVDDPTFRAAHDDPDERVVAVDRGEARAYPLRYLDYHEVVNDEVDAEPVAVTWCPLCGSAVVYGRRVDGRALTFGVSGKLADDDLVLYDRETGTEWKQSSGVAIDGPLEGTELPLLPSTVTTWDRFGEAHPDGRVLAPPGGESEAAGHGDDPEPIDYDAESPYADYLERPGFGLAAHRGEENGREWPRTDIAPKAVVLGVEHDGEALGFPLPEVRDAGGTVTATVGDRSVLVTATEDGIHAFASEGYTFEQAADGRLRADGTRWDPATGRSADGRRLDRLPARRLFAFAWRDDHGADAFWTNG